MAFAPDKIRNVAVVGHRGTGKTSLTEALLFQAGEITRLGSVADGTTVSDHDDDERRRGLSISARPHPRGVERAQAEPDRHAGRPELSGRGPRLAARGGGCAVRDLGRARDRGLDGTPVEALRGARHRTCRVREHARPRARRLRRRARVAAVAALEEPRGDQPSDRRGARLHGRRRPAAHGGVRGRSRWQSRGRSGRDSRGPPGAGRGVAGAAHGPRGRGLRRPDGALSRGPADLGRGARRRVQGSRRPGRAVPRRLRRGLAQRRDARVARPDRRRASVAGARRADPRPRSLGRRRRPRARGIRRRRVLLQDDRGPACRQAQPAARVRGAHRPRDAARQRAHAPQGARRADPLVPGHASIGRCPTWGRAISVPCRS